MSRMHHGRITVISGAASGIGQASAVRLANEGARFVVADRANAQQTLKLVTASGGTATAIVCDVSNPASVAELKAEVESNIGQCDILVNNAGIFPTQRFEDITFEDWRRVLSVNLDSMFLMTKAFAGGMRQRGWGRVINIASLENYGVKSHPETTSICYHTVLRQPFERTTLSATLHDVSGSNRPKAHTSVSVSDCPDRVQVGQ
jgi:NAD(P)-dependent dehydrogenase (short-subunit alcohol dehydrogenase family)